jgi:hypothetical protein
MASLTTIYLDRLQCQIDAGYYDYEKSEVPPNGLLVPSVEELDEIPRVRFVCPSITSVNERAGGGLMQWRLNRS